MSPVEPTIWDLEPHTQAKHEILHNYLNGWFPILSKWSGRIVYIDGFAGPGIYSKGEEGSPLIALRTADEHMLRSRFKEIVFVFIESRKDRAEKLEEVIKINFPTLPESFKYEVISGEFEDTLLERLDELERSGDKLAPCFAFIDPFGYTGFSMDLLSKLLSHDKCEVLITFMAGFVRRFLDDLREPALDVLFGTNDWRDIQEKSGNKAKHLLDLYEKQLKDCCGVEYSRSFEMVGANGQIIYYMVFCTKHWLGLKVMKEAMWRVDRRGEYLFSDQLGRAQTFLMDYQDDQFWVPEAAENVYQHFKGQSATIDEIEKHIIISTKFIFRKSILNHIEDNNPKRIQDVFVPRRSRRKRSFPNDCVVTFS